MKRIGQIALDILEIYVPAISFAVMFVVFVVQVFYRYYLNLPLTWPPEVISTTFIWTTVLGACYAQRKLEHVSFTVVYERLPAQGQLIFRLLGNSLVALAFLIALPAVYSYVQFMSFQRTTVLKVPFNVVYFPFLIFQVLITGRLLYAVYQDLRVVFGKAPLVRDEVIHEASLVETGHESIS
ncbi:MAG: TRAP transporter small permease subunit [Caldilineaceae bacterium]|nr:TRAP transporter small permease subunit [Caldilineaceae bacterium]